MSHKDFLDWMHDILVDLSIKIDTKSLSTIVRLYAGMYINVPSFKPVK